MIIDTHIHGYPRDLKVFDGIRRDPIKSFDASVYLNMMDQHEIDMSVLSMPSGTPYGIDDHSKALDLAKAVNDMFVEACEKHPARFKAFAHLPLKDPENCLREMERALDELQLSGVCVPTNVAGNSLDEERFMFFFEEANRKRTPVLMHPVSTPCDSRWRDYALHVRIGWLVESSLATYRLVASGVSDRFPDFPFIASHMGGSIYYFIDRLNRRSNDLACIRRPEEYLKRVYYDTAGPVRSYAIKCACEFAGASQVLFGTDYPYGEEDEESFVVKTLRAVDELDVSADEKEMICSGNAKRILSLG